ncbi:polyprenyl synthetase family protein [Salinicoccus hispanicus]|uniref:Polyprenyl synthetase family protein n=1 Tax=Salinicoccus hispanicus TaxID=157225 RepID=A0A6N8TX65_9STAP|nr:polyprenyl synthetase family protein [Salinicoccus hispanicus]MXQ50273.1 polyprenyl synthetase family protein [Salinicoccus hispanicus]
MKTVKQYLASDFEAVGDIIKENLDPNEILVHSKSYELFRSGGKKIRPTFTLLVGRLGETGRYPDVLKASASLELIHMATLVHDDIIDNSRLRRGRSTVYYEHGYLQAINTGNYLLSTSLSIVSTIEHKALHEAFSQAIRDIVDGEIFQLDHQFNTYQTLDDYYTKIYRKTALLIELSIKMGAYAANVDQRILDGLLVYGYHIGMSFQIIDDCLDFIGNEKTLGKPKFSDLENGHYTLPVLMLRDEDPDFSNKLHAFDGSREKLDELIGDLLASDAIDRSIAISNTYIDKARAAIEDIDEPIRTYLMEIAEKLSNRLN